jgi:ATP-dependent 26S proteasome regulatory subunit
VRDKPLLLWLLSFDGTTYALLQQLYVIICACVPTTSADEIDAIGTKRYESQSSGEREIQRTMLELLNQLDGFDAVGDVKVRFSCSFTYSYTLSV